MRLPQYPAEQQLEAESLVALRNLLPTDLFVVRDRLDPDFGVDGHLELVDNGFATNFVVPFQMKARSTVTCRRDGVRTLPIPSATLGYLLNAPIALVFLFDAAAKTIHWSVASHEYQRLRGAGVDPERKASVTLEFSRVLDREVAAELHGELLLASKALRTLRGALANLDPDALAHVTASWEVATTSDIEARFFATAPALAMGGQLDEVERLFGLMRPAARRSPRAQFFLAYAHSCNGRPLATLMHAVEALREESELEPAERDLAKYLRASAGHFMGSVSREAMEEAREHLFRTAPPQIVVPLEIATLRSQAAAEMAEDGLSTLALRATELETRTSRLLGRDHSVTLTARVFKLQCEGQHLVEAHLAAQLAMHGAPVDLVVEAENQAALDAAIVDVRLEKWRSDVEALIDVSTRWAPRRLHASHLLLLMSMSMLKHKAMLNAAMGFDARTATIREQSTVLARAIERELEQTRSLRLDEDETRFRLLLVDTLDLAGLEERRRVEAAELLRLAVIGDYKVIADEARDRQGPSYVDRTFAELTEHRERSLAELQRTLDNPQELDQKADDGRVELALPRSTLPVLRDHVECDLTLEAAQRRWCRFLEVAEFVPDKFDAAQFYSRPAIRRCVCVARELTSPVPSDDWRTLLETFRRAHCEGCSRRLPRI